MSSAPVSKSYDEFVAGDDYLHEFDSHPWRVETWWFSFFVPERGLGGWLYGLMRPNQRSSNGGLWVWDAESAEPRTAPYFAHYTALPTRLDRVSGEPVHFPSSMAIEVTEPAQRYRLRYEDETAGVRLALDFAAVMPAVGFKQEQPPFGRSAHFDQAGRVTGEVVLAGVTLPVDCYAMRDRSWGLRSEKVAPRFSYLWLAGPTESMLVYAERDDAGAARLAVTRGFLHRDGISRPIVSGTRVEQRDADRHWITSVRITATDEARRTVDILGTARSRIVHPRAISTNTISVLEFEGEDGAVWGEDQDVWAHTAWKSAVACWTAERA